MTTEQRVENLENDVNTLKAAQAESARQISQLSMRVDEFIFQAQRLISNNAKKANRADAAVESLADTLRAFAQQAERDRAEIRTAQQECQRIWEYLLNQNQQN